MADETVSDKLAKSLSEPDYAIIGKALVETAQKDNNEAIKDAIISGVATILKDINHQKLSIEVAQARIDLQDRRISALQSGEFKIDEVTGTVVFDDNILNVGSCL